MYYVYVCVCVCVRACVNLKKAAENFKKIYVKKDIHPEVRKEWKRLHAAERTEMERAENAGCVIHFNIKERILYRNGVVIDSWNLQAF